MLQERLHRFISKEPREGLELLHSFVAAGGDHEVRYAWGAGPGTEEIHEAVDGQPYECNEVPGARAAAATNHRILCHARKLHARFLSEGYQPHMLPNLTGRAGNKWFHRWRKRFGIKDLKKVRHFKVSWATLKQRVRVYLKNVFALRFLWRLCFGARPMRWASWAQTSAGFNITALDSSLYAAYQQRISICTCVHTDILDQPDTLPPVGVLFKAQPDGAVRRALDADPDIPAWMTVRTQAKGYYRAEDMVELLSAWLPQVDNDFESTVVCLDSYLANKDKAVAEVIRSRGHVLLLHGAGTTGYEQINHTHLHAELQARMKEFKGAVFYKDLTDTQAVGATKAVSHSRHDLCMLVKQVWASLPHSAISHTGYKETGPMLPLTGPIYMQDVGRDLRDVLKDMCPHEDPLQIGTQIREEAEELVNSMWGHEVNSWADCRLVLEDHVEHRAQAEGEEAMEFEKAPTDNDDADADDDGDRDSSGGEDADGDGGGGQGYQPHTEGYQPHTESPSGAAGSHGSDQAVQEESASNIMSEDLRAKEFRTAMLEEALALGDTKVVRVLRSALNNAERKSTAQKSTERTDSYSEIAAKMKLGKQVNMSAIRTRKRKDQDEAIEVRT